MASKRKEQAMRTRQKLLDKGLELLDARGYDDVTVEDITSACGVSKGTFYLYFESKEAFFSALEISPYESIEDEIEAMGAAPVAEKLRHYVSSWLRMLSGYSPAFTRGWVRFSASPDYLEKYGEKAKTVYDRNVMRSILEEGVESGELVPETPSETIANIVCATLYGTTMRYAAAGDAVDFEAWERALCTELVPRLVDPYRAG